MATFQPMPRESVDVLRRGADRMGALVEGGVDPTDALVKAATELRIRPGHVPLLARAYNTAASEAQRKSAADTAEAAAEFPLADAQQALEQLYPREPDSPGQEHHKQAVAAEYDRPAARSLTGRQAVPFYPGGHTLSKEAAAGVLAAVRRAAPPPVLPPDPVLAAKTAQLRLYQGEKQAETARHAWLSAYRTMQTATRKVAACLIRYPAPDPYTAERAVIHQNGAAGRALFSLLKKADGPLGAAAPRLFAAAPVLPPVTRGAGSAAGSAPLAVGPGALGATGVSPPALGKLGSAVPPELLACAREACQAAQACQELRPAVDRTAADLERIKSALACEALGNPGGPEPVVRLPARLGPAGPPPAPVKEAQYEETLGVVSGRVPFARRPLPAGAAPTASAVKEAGIGIGMVGMAAGTTMGREIAQRIPLQKPIAGMEKRVLEQLTDPRHEDELRGAKIQGMLNEFMTDDDVIKGYHPQEVVQHFNGIAQLMPHGTDQKEVMRSLLRKRLQQGAMDPFEIDMMLRMENQLKNRDRAASPDPSGGSPPPGGSSGIM